MTAERGSPQPEPAIVVVDSHQHCWQRHRHHPPVLAGSLLDRDFLPADFDPPRRAAGVDATVLVNAADTAAETDWMLSLAAAHSWIRAVVGWIPLEDATTAARLLDGWAETKLRGVRPLIHERPDDAWLTGTALTEGLALLADRRLSLDVVAVRPGQLRSAITLAARHPALTIVLDHLGKPPIRMGGWEPWASLLGELASLPNVSAKISGLATAADPRHWSVDDVRPYVEHAIGCFGPDRLMIGGDWPICLQAGAYEQVWQAHVAATLTGLGPVGKAAALGGTAARLYRL